MTLLDKPNTRIFGLLGKENTISLLGGRLARETSVCGRKFEQENRVSCNRDQRNVIITVRRLFIG